MEPLLSSVSDTILSFDSTKAQNSNRASDGFVKVLQLTRAALVACLVAKKVSLWKAQLQHGFLPEAQTTTTKFPPSFHFTGHCGRGSLRWTSVCGAAIVLTSSDVPCSITIILSIARGARRRFCTILVSGPRKRRFLWHRGTRALLISVTIFYDRKKERENKKKKQSIFQRCVFS